MSGFDNMLVLCLRQGTFYSYRKPSLLPGCETSQKGGRLFETVFEQDLRRTGAGLLRRSGAVGDDPFLLVEFF